MVLKFLLVPLVVLGLAMPPPVKPSTAQYTLPPNCASAGPAPTLPATPAETPDASHWARAYAMTQMEEHWCQYGFRSRAQVASWVKKVREDG